MHKLSILLSLQGLKAVHYVEPDEYSDAKKGAAILELLLNSGADVNAQDHKVPAVH